MNDNGYIDNNESRFSWAQALIAAAETPAPRLATVTRIHPRHAAAPARRTVTASRRRDGSFRTDHNVLQTRRAADGMAVYNLRESVGM